MTPDDLIDFLGIEEPNEIELEAIAMSQNILVKYRPLSSCEAKIIGFGDKAVVTVDSNQTNVGRQRFSIAHEIGHWMNDRGKAFICDPGDINRPYIGRTDPESRANAFAAELLMPRTMIAARIKTLPLTIDTARKLANEFSTSLTAMAIRIVQLSDAPAILAWYSQTGRIRFSRTSTVPPEIWPVEQVDHETSAFVNLFANNGITKAEEVDADSWVSHRDSYKYTVIESSVSDTPDTVMVLIWWKDESQLLDLD